MAKRWSSKEGDGTTDDDDDGDDDDDKAIDKRGMVGDEMVNARLLRRTRVETRR